MNSPVAITGMGAVTPLGVGVAALHDRAVAGICGLTDGVGRCVDFDPLTVLTRKHVHRTDRFAQFALVAADEAVRQAGWQGEVPYEATRVMTIVGSAVGGIQTIEAKLAELRASGPEFVSGLSSLMANAAAAQIAIAYQLRGEAYCIASACASGAQAIGAGLRAIQRGQADAVIVGGAEASISEFVCSAFLNAGAMSVSGKSVPFDRDRDGFLMGEGAGILVLEAAERARRRGAEVLGLLHGYGSTCDAHHMTAPDESGVAARAAVRLALTEAGLAPGEIDYINAHGTGTLLNDRQEVAALRAVFGDALERIPISSTKSSVGHLIGAAGAVEAVATIAALRANVVPPTVGLSTPDEELGPLRHVVHGLPLELPGGRGGRAMSTSFGFGGHNAVLVFSTPGECG